MQPSELRQVAEQQLASLGSQSSRTIHQAVLAGGEAGRTAADVLHGTWLEHPLHPVLTDVTIGAWLMAGLMDYFAETQDHDGARWAGDRLTEVGAASAAATALSGLADYSTAPRWSSATAFAHGAINSANLALYFLSIRDRRAGNRKRGLLFSGVALGMTAVSAWLGGRLVYRDRVGVDHRDWFHGPTDWTPVLDASDLPDRQPLRVEHKSQGILLYREGDRISAIGSRCGHAGGPLEHGMIQNGCVTCPWHDSVFRLRDGSVVHGPATRQQPSFDVRIRQGKVEIKLASL